MQVQKEGGIQGPSGVFLMDCFVQVAPKDIFEHTTHECARLNGIGLHIKELQFVAHTYNCPPDRTKESHIG